MSYYRDQSFFTFKHVRIQLFQFFSNLPVREVTRIYKLIYYLQAIKMDVLVSASRTAHILLWSHNAHLFLKQCIKCGASSYASNYIALSFTVSSVVEITYL